MEHNIKFNHNTDGTGEGFAVTDDFITVINNKTDKIFKETILEVLETPENLDVIETDNGLGTVGHITKSVLSERLVNDCTLEELVFLATEAMLFKIEETWGNIRKDVVPQIIKKID